jgi:hypothetical protein
MKFRIEHQLFGKPCGSAHPIDQPISLTTITGRGQGEELAAVLEEVTRGDGNWRYLFIHLGFSLQ